MKTRTFSSLYKKQPGQDVKTGHVLGKQDVWSPYHSLSVPVVASLRVCLCKRVQFTQRSGLSKPFTTSNKTICLFSDWGLLISKLQSPPPKKNFICGALFYSRRNTDLRSDRPVLINSVQPETRRQTDLRSVVWAHKFSGRCVTVRVEFCLISDIFSVSSLLFSVICVNEWSSSLV